MENKISVVVCTYNQEDTIARTLDSILMQQCHLPYEIIIGEDCSTDNTLSICQQYAEHHPGIIRVMANKPNKGVVRNYFDCLLAADGKYIADCAGDDFWTDPLKLEKEVSVMEQHPEVTLVLTRWNWYDEATRQETPCAPPPFSQAIVKGTDALETILTQRDMSVYHLSSSLYSAEAFRKAYAEDAFLFRNNDFATEDISLVFMLARYGDIAYLPDFTMNYSIGKPSVSNLTNHEKLFRFFRQITGLTHYLIEHYNLHTTRTDQFMETRLFALSMHAFRSFNPDLSAEVFRCAEEWHVCLTPRLHTVFFIMRHRWLWRIGLLARKGIVSAKQALR